MNFSDAINADERGYGRLIEAELTEKGHGRARSLRKNDRSSGPLQEI